MKNPLTWLGERMVPVAEFRASLADRQREIAALQLDVAPLAELRALLADQQRQIAALQLAVRQQRESSEIFEKAFRVTGFVGDYVEFGSFRGDSLIQAYFASLRVLEQITSGFWDHSYDEPGETKTGFQYSWDQMRFIAFDSFQGVPESAGIDTVYTMFPKGSYSCGEEEFRNNLRAYGIADAKAPSVPGFFRDTLNDATAKTLDLKQLSIIHIDSDLYESARDALAFCTPFLCDGTIVVFDEWFQFRGNPNLGEQRAFQEWKEAHPQWIATPFQKEGAYRNSFILSRPHP